MAQKQETLYLSQIEGASIDLIYDDVTLIATGIIATVGAITGRSMVITIDKGFPTEQVYTIPSNRLNQVINFPANRLPHGTVVTTRFGTQTISWGFKSLGVAWV